MQTATKLDHLHIVIMTSIVQGLDLLKRFNPSDTRDVSEKDMEMKLAQDLEMKMKEICHRRSSALFEPKAVVKVAERKGASSESGVKAG